MMLRMRTVCTMMMMAMVMVMMIVMNGWSGKM